MICSEESYEDYIVEKVCKGADHYDLAIGWSCPSFCVKDKIYSSPILSEVEEMAMLELL